MSFQNPFSNFSSHPVFKIASVYLVSAWLIIQVAATIFPVFSISNNWLKGLVIVLVVGFLITTAWTWYKSSKTLSRPHQKKFNLAMIGGMTLIFGIGLTLFINRISGEKSLSEAVKNERVAVPFFNNETGDVTLDGLGSYLSLVLTEGFKEIGVKTVNTNTVRQCMRFVNYFPGNIENQISFTEATGAGLTINGNIYLEEDSILTVKSILTDALTGEEIKYFPEIKGTKNDRKALSNDLKQKILGYWVNQEEVKKGKFKAPNYDAYLANVEGDEVFWFFDQSIPLYEKALALDSNFYMNYIDLSIAYNNTLQTTKRKVLLDRLYAKRDLLTQYEKILLDRELAWSRKDRKGYLDKCLEAFELDPKNFGDNFFAGYASNISAKPYQTIRIYSQLDDRTVNYTNNVSNQTRLRDFSDAYLMTNQPKKALDYLETWAPEKTKFFAPWSNKIQAIVALNNRPKLDDLILKQSDFSFPSGMSAQTYFIYRAAMEYNIRDNERLAQEYAQKALDRARSEGGIADYIYHDLYYILENWDEVYTLCSKMIQEDPTNTFALSSLALAAMAQLETNTSDRVNEIMEILENLDLSDKPTAIITDPNANVDIALASIYAHQGETGEAIAYLKKAIDNNANPLEFQRNMKLKPLFDHPQLMAWSTPKE